MSERRWGLRMPAGMAQRPAPLPFSHKRVWGVVPLLVLVGVSLAADAASPSATFYVAPQGNDQWSGRIATPSADGRDGPFATLERARDAVRQTRAGRGASHTLAEWRAQGYDQRSLVADPRFVDPQHDNYALRPDSPALRLGFQPIDVSQVGPRTPRPACGP